MSLIDKFKAWTNLDEYEQDGQSEQTESAPAEEKPSVFSFDSVGSRGSSRASQTSVNTKLEVVLVKPDSFDDAADIADNLKATHIVVLNLESTNRDTSRRLLDFLSGVAYALSGKIQRIANNTFIVMPCNVNMSGDVMDELENSGIYF